MASCAKPKHLLLRQPEVSLDVSRGAEEGSFDVPVTCDIASPWTRLHLRDGNAQFSDNLIHIAPHMPANLTVTPA